MRTGLGVSVAAHAAVLAFGVLALPSTTPYEIEAIEALPVDLVTLADDSDLKQGDKRAEALPDETPQPKAEALAPTPAPEPTEEPADKPVEAARQPTPRPTPAPTPEPPPTEPEQVAALPSPAAPPPPAAQPEPLAEADPEISSDAPAPRPRARPKPPKQVAQPKPEPAKEAPKPRLAETKPEEPKKQFSSDDIAALLNQQDPVGGGDPAPSPEPQTVGVADGRPDAAMTQSWIAALSAKLAACWNVPAGVRDAQTLRVVVGFNLLPDGSLTGAPTLIEISGVSNPLAAVAAEAAKRAVEQCGPYDDIFPVEHYAIWQSIKVTFDPREMFRSG